MIYLANNEIIKQPELIQDLPSLSLPVLDGVETGATIVLGTQLSVNNMPTGATLYVNGSSVQGSTFTITPLATAVNNGYNYTITLQFKGVSGYQDSDVATYTLKMKNAAPTVNQNSQVTTSASLTVAISRTDTTYVTDLDVKYGVGTDTTTGNSGTSVTITNTSVNSQYNFWIAATNYADKSEIVTKYYHIVGSEQLPSCDISYNENDENFTINIASFPSDPDLGNYMSSTGYTIYYSLNSETIDTQYNNIAVSCNAGDTIRAQVSSSYGWQSSEVASYTVPVPVVETPTLGDGFDGFYALSNNDSFQYSPTNGTYIQYLGINGSYTYWTDASEELVEIYDSTLASAVESAELTPGQFVDPNGFTATKSVYQNKHQLNTISGLSFDSQYVDIDDGNPYEESTFESLSATTLALTNVDTSHYESYNEYYKLTNVKIVDAAEDGRTFVAYDVNQNACIVYDQMGIFANETLNYDITQYDIYGFISTYRGMVQFYPVLIEESATQNSTFANQYNVTVLKGLDLACQDNTGLQTRQLSGVTTDIRLTQNMGRLQQGPSIVVYSSRVSKIVVVDGNYNSVTSQSRGMQFTTDWETYTPMTNGNAGSCTFTTTVSGDFVSVSNNDSEAYVGVLAMIIVEQYLEYSAHPVWYDKVEQTWYDARLNHHDNNAGLYWYNEAPTENCCIAVMIRDNTGAPYEPSNSATIATTGGNTTRWTYGWYYDNVNDRYPGTGLHTPATWGEGGIEISNVNGNGAATVLCGYRYGESKTYNIATDPNNSFWTDALNTQIYYKLFDSTLSWRLIYYSEYGAKPSSITVTSSDTNVFTVSNNGRYLESVGYGMSTITFTYTDENSNTYTYQTEAQCEEPQPPSFSDNYSFRNVDSGDEYNDGDEFEIPANINTGFEIWDIANAVAVTPDTTPTCSSDDDTIATIGWSGTQFDVSFISEGATTLTMEITINGATYNTSFNVIVTASE